MRKVTDFFKPSSPSQGGRAQHHRPEKDTIHVAQPSAASLPRSKTNDKAALEGATCRSISPPPVKALGGDARRVALQGKLVIKSSDDEDDSDSSLENLDNLLGVSNRRQREGKVQLSSPALVTPQYKFSLGSLLDQTEKDAVAEAGILEARAALALPDPTTDIPRGPSQTSNPNAEDANHRDGKEAGEGLLASVVKEQGGQRDLQKIMHAMNRTEALNRPKAWYFFKDGSTNVGREVRDCPECVSSVRWQAMLRDPSLRHQAFTTGFAAEMVARQSCLPDEMILWILEECRLYTSAIRHHLPADVSILLHFEGTIPSKLTLCLAAELGQSASERIHRLLDDVRIVHLLRILGGSEQAVDIMSAVQPVPQLPSGPRDMNWTKTVSFIQMLDAVAPYLSTKATEHTICILGRLSIDSTIIHSADVLQTIDRAYTSLLHSIPEQEWEASTSRIRNTIFSSLAHPPFRLQLLESLPMHTPLTRLFRDHLALTFLFDSPSKPASPPLNIPHLTHHLQTARQFSIHNNTDYANLSAYISILDTCLSGPSHPLTKDEETAFNKDIDALAAQLRVMFTRIIDTGASHMTRTEAKEIINRVYYKLIYGVRTKQRAKKSIFSSVSAEEEEIVDGGEGPLRRLFAKVKEGGTHTGSREV